MEEKNFKEELQELLESQVGTDIKTLIAFLVRKTKTTTDDEIIENIDEVVDIISESLSEVADQHPDDKAARDAGMRLLKALAAQTKTKWDDRILAVVDKIV